MLADGLISAITFNVLRPLIPSGYPALRIEHQDCVILDSADQKVWSLVALLQDLFGLFAFGDVGGDHQAAVSALEHYGARGDLNVDDSPVLLPMPPDACGLCAIRRFLGTFQDCRGVFRGA